MASRSFSPCLIFCSPQINQIVNPQKYVDKPPPIPTQPAAPVAFLPAVAIGADPVVPRSAGSASILSSSMNILPGHCSCYACCDVFLLLSIVFYTKIIIIIIEPLFFFFFSGLAYQSFRDQTVGGHLSPSGARAVRTSSDAPASTFFSGYTGLNFSGYRTPP